MFNSFFRFISEGFKNIGINIAVLDKAYNQILLEDGQRNVVKQVEEEEFFDEEEEQIEQAKKQRNNKENVDKTV